MQSSIRCRAWWALGFALVLVAGGGTGWAQPSTDPPPAPEAVAPLPAGEGASELRAAFAALLDLAAGDQAMVSFVDHAAVRAGGANAYAWFGLQLVLGVVGVGHLSDTSVVEGATGLALGDVATTVVVDAELPSYLTLVRGRFDADLLDAALTARGYASVADEHAQRWCGPKGCDGGYLVDLEQRDPAFALFGGVLGRTFPAVLAGDLLAVSPEMEALDATLATAAGLAPSLLERPEVAALVDALDVDAVVRQVWMPISGYARYELPADASTILFADVRRGDDEWLVVAVAFERPLAANAFARGVLAALHLTDDAEGVPSAFQSALRAHTTGATVDQVDHRGMAVVRIMLTRPFADGVGSADDRPAQLLHTMLAGVMRYALSWTVR